MAPDAGMEIHDLVDVQSADPFSRSTAVMDGLARAPSAAAKTGKMSKQTASVAIEVRTVSDPRLLAYDLNTSRVLRGEVQVGAVQSDAMERKRHGARTLLILAFFLLSTFPIPAQASSDPIVWSVSTDAIVYEGTDARISVNIENQIDSSLSGIEVRLYRESKSPENQMGDLELLNLDQGQSKSVEQVWNAIPWGNDGKPSVYVDIKVNGSLPFQGIETISLTAAPNLHILSAEMDNSTTIRQSNLLAFNATVENSGHANASSSAVELVIENAISSAEISRERVSLPSIDSGNNTTVRIAPLGLFAPPAGNYRAVLVVDPDLTVSETILSDNSQTLQFSVIPHADHALSLSKSKITAVDPVEGPWIVNGSIQRDHDSASSNVTVALRSDQLGVLKTVVVNVPHGIGANQPFSIEFDHDDLLASGSLGDGEHAFYVEIIAGDHQGQNNNDVAETRIDFLNRPNVKISASLLTTQTDSVLPNTDVRWLVVVENEGGVPVDGIITVSWEGSSKSLPGRSVSIEPYSPAVAEFAIQAGSIEIEDAQFQATWTPSASNQDRISTDNLAVITLSIRAPFEVSLDPTSERISPDPDGSLDPSQSYTIYFRARLSKAGTTEITCHRDGETIKSTTITAAEINDEFEIECPLTLTDSDAGSVILITYHSSSATLVGDYLSFEKKVKSISGTLGVAAQQEKSRTLAIVMLSMITVLAGVVLYLAIRLTSDTDREVDRDIYEYCPYCTGEIEGDEVTCPHCYSDLGEAMSNFHTCAGCDEEVPDIMEICPHCGTDQRRIDRFEHRERRAPEVIDEEIASEEDNFEDETEQEIVIGTADFNQATKSFGVSDEDFESKWDDELESAEQQMAELVAAAEAEIDDDELASDGEIISPLLEQHEQQSAADLDSFLGDKDQRKSLSDKDVEFTASDAAIRGNLYDITGEEGVMPGDKVVLGSAMTDHAIPGNEVLDDKSLTSFAGLDTETSKVRKEKAKPKRRAARKKKVVEESEKGACPSCSAIVSLDADSCHACGAKFG